MTATDEGDAVGVADGVRAGRVRAVDVMTATLTAIEERNPTINAFVFVAEPDALLRISDEIDRQIAAGTEPGRLAGVPFGVKDLEDVAGMPTTNGSLSGDAEPAGADSRVVGRLRAAGGIPVGKTNTPEFGYSIDTANRRFGRTHNPRDPSRTPGGSSGGSAAAVAGGMVPVATGSDGGGSVRIPAAFCGTPGLKPTAGLIATDVPDSWGGLTEAGVLTRSVRDVARCLDVLSDRLEVTSVEASLATPVRLEDLRAVASVDLHGATVEDEVAEAFVGALGRLGGAGLDIEVLESPLPDSREIFRCIAGHADAQHLERLSDDERSRLSRGYLAWLEEGARVTAEEVMAAAADRERLRAKVDELLAHADLILSPTVGIRPWLVRERLQMDPMQVMFTHPFNLTGHPAVSVPLPGILAGMQAAGPRLDESGLLRFAEAALRVLDRQPESIA